MTTAWNPLVRDGWKRLREISGPTPTKGEVYAWLHSLVEFAVYNSGKQLLILDLAAYGFDPEHMARVLDELERSGDILTAGGSLVLLAALANTCAAPSSVHQIPRIKKLNEGIDARLSAPWQRALIDVTARADAERKSRQHGVKQTLLERLKEALDVHLHAVPDPGDSSLQLELPFTAPRPEMRIVKTDDLDEQALCMLALIGADDGTDPQNAEASPRSSRDDGQSSDARHDALGLFHGADPVAPAVAARADAAVLARTSADVRQAIGNSNAKDPTTEAGRAMAAQGKDPAATLQHDPAREARGRASGAGVSADRDRGGRGLAAGRGGQAGAAPSAAGAVSQVVRSGASGEAKLGLVEVWDELRRLLPELAQPRRYRDRMSGEVSTGLPGRLHHALVDGFVQTQQADPPGTMDDFRLLAEWVKAGNLHYLNPVEWCAHICNSLPVVLDKSAAWKQSGKPNGKPKGSPPLESLNPAHMPAPVTDAVLRAREVRARSS